MSDTILDLALQTHFGDQRLQEKLKTRELNACLVAAAKDELHNTFVNVSGRIPIDESRFDFINKALRANFKITSKEIENALCGPMAERLYRCIDCQSCRTCLKESRNEAISIERIKEDALFREMVHLDKEKGLISCRLPLPSDYRSKLANNRMAAKRRLLRELTKLRHLEISKEQVKAAFQKYRKYGFLLKMSELPEEQQKKINQESVHHFMQVSIAYKSTSLSSAARICFDGSSSSGPSGASINQILPKGETTLNLPGCFQGFLSYPHVSVADIRCFYNSFVLPLDQQQSV